MSDGDADLFTQGFKKIDLSLVKASGLLLKDVEAMRYFEYSTCTGAGVVGISLKVGNGRSGGAVESLVQQPQDEERIATAQTETASKN